MDEFTKEELVMLRSGLCRLIANAPWESNLSIPIVKLHKKIDDKIKEFDNE